MVPTVAVQRSQNGNFVFVVKDGKVDSAAGRRSIAHRSGQSSVIDKGLWTAARPSCVDGQLLAVPTARAVRAARPARPGA